MSEEDLNRKMEFIVEQQAQFTADIQVLKERQTAFQGELETLAAAANSALAVASTAQAVANTAHAVAIASLETMTKTGEVVTTIAEAQAEGQRQIADTQRQLVRLATLVEAHVRDGHSSDASLR